MGRMCSDFEKCNQYNEPGTEKRIGLDLNKDFYCKG